MTINLEIDDNALLLEPREYYDKCIIGTTYYGDRAIYDSELVLQSLMTDQEMTEEEALDWFEYNIVGSYLGEQTPIFLRGVE